MLRILSLVVSPVASAQIELDTRMILCFSGALRKKMARWRHRTATSLGWYGLTVDQVLAGLSIEIWLLLLLLTTVDSLYGFFLEVGFSSERSSPFTQFRLRMALFIWNRITQSYRTITAGVNSWTHSGWINPVIEFVPPRLCICFIKIILVGTGFSTADSKGGYGRSMVLFMSLIFKPFVFLQWTIRNKWLKTSYVINWTYYYQLKFISHQLGFLSNLVKVFPSLAKRPFLLTGESYAGQYIVRTDSYLLTYIISWLNLNITSHILRKKFFHPETLLWIWESLRLVMVRLVRSRVMRSCLRYTIHCTRRWSVHSPRFNRSPFWKPTHKSSASTLMFTIISKRSMSFNPSLFQPELPLTMPSSGNTFANMI